METTSLKYNLVFINLSWLLGVQMNNIIFRGSHSLKILNIVLIQGILYIALNSVCSVISSMCLVKILIGKLHV